MSVFSQLLNGLVREQKVNITDMARYCDYDRPTLHKILNGDRTPPSTELVQRFCRYLNLSLADSEKLTEAYFAALFGEETYDEFLAVKDFVLNFDAAVIPSLPVSSPLSEESAEPLPDAIALTSVPDVHNALSYLLCRTSECADRTITLIAQPNCGTLCQYLEKATSGLDLSIHHLLCLDNQSDDGKAAAYNMNCLKSVLNLFSALSDYHVFYYYDDATARFSNYALHPCLIVSDAGALITNAGFTQGILHTHAGAINLYRQHANILSEHCAPLFNIYTNVIEELETYSCFQGGLNVMEALPCVLNYHCLTKEILESVVLPEIPERQNMITMIDTYLSNRAAHFLKDRSHSYFTENGLVYFAKSGRFPEIPENFYRPLTPAERLTVLKNMIPLVKNGTYRLLQKMDLDVYLGVCLQENTLTLTAKSSNNLHNIIVITEPRLTGMFRRFFEHLDDYHYLLSEEKTLHVLYDTIALLEKEGDPS